jgi:hypothetical protein
MKGKGKGSNAKRTPSQNRITGEGFTNQRYKNQSWEKQFKLLDFEFNKGFFTMKSMSLKTGIDRANICRYIGKRRNLIFTWNLKWGIMENKLLPIEHYKREAIDHCKRITGSRKTLFTIADAMKVKEYASERVKVILDSLSFLHSEPLRENDYFKFVNSYFIHKVKLNEKYFRHDLEKLHKYYDAVDGDKHERNPFSIVSYQSYVLFMALKLHGVYEAQDDVVFNVKVQDCREYNPLTKIPSVLRGSLHFKVKEYDIKRAFPSFIDLELGIDKREEVYDVISKSDFARFLNSNNETNLSIEDVRKGLFPVYGDLVYKIITNERYNEKGRAFRDFAKYEQDYIKGFVESNNLSTFARLHDGVFVLENVKCDNLNFGKVNFSIKESIKPPIINNTISFYEVNTLGNIHTTASMYADFLKQEKFIRLQTHDDKIQLLKDSNNVVSFFNHKTDMVSFLESEINEVKTDAVRNAIARDNGNVLQQSYTLLPPVKLEYYKDTKNSFGLPFINGFFYFDEVTGFDIKRKEYKDVRGFFTPHQIQNRSFEYSDETGVFETFIQRVATGVSTYVDNEHKETVQAFNSMIGYLCHNYKSYTQSPCIVLTDEGANDETRNGGRGKSIIGNGIREVTKLMFKGGNEFAGSYLHNFADLDESYNVYLLDDIPAGFNFNDLYTNITAGINIQPKGTKARMIEFEDTPKFLITTNWLFRYDENDTSTNRRFVEYKIKPYYNINHTPKDEFQHTFFEDWDKEEWNRFYSFIFRCVHFYLVNGIQRIAYDKTEDNYRALFGSDAREQEMARVMERLLYPDVVFGLPRKLTSSFTVTDFLKIYNEYDNPMRNEKLFSAQNARKYIDVYLTQLKGIQFHYEQRTKRWFNVTLEH